MALSLQVIRMPVLARALALFAFAALAAGAAPANAERAPDTPASVSVTRADGTLTASWPAVKNASSYHVTYSDDGGASWSLAALNHPSSSITISVDNASTYIVGVRARNKHGDSGWRNSPSAGPFTPPAPSNPPATPGSVSVTRADGSLTASWPAVKGATSYHVTYSDDGGASWSLAALNHPDNSITIGGDNASTYIVGVRARNEHGDSGWRNSPSAGPYTPPAPSNPPATPSSVSVTRGDGTLTASWPAVEGATSYHVTYSDDSGASWSLAALNHPDSSIDITGVDNASTYIVGVRARNGHGDSGWRNSLAAEPTAPTVSATLSIADASADEGQALSFAVTLNNAVPGGFTVTPTFTDGVRLAGRDLSAITANQGSDYGAGAQTLDFAGTAGEKVTLTVPTIEDGVAEYPELFTVGLSVSGTSHRVTATDTAIGTIWDDDAGATAMSSKHIQDKGTYWRLWSPPDPVTNRYEYYCDISKRVVETTNRAIRSKLFQIPCKVHQGGIPAGAVVEMWASGSSTATNGSSGDWDYNFYHTKFTMYPGDSGTQRLSFNINDDQGAEAAESFQFAVKWTTKVGYPPFWFTLNESVHTMTVNIDDDDDFQLTVSPESVAEGGGAKIVTVTATNASGAALAEARKISVQVGTTGDLAVEGTDYQTVNNFDITIPKGSSSGTGTFTLTPIDDAHLEAGERISLSGSGSTQINGRTLTPRVRGAGLWLTDNETITLSATPDIDEGGGTQTVTVTATASGTAERAIPLTISVGKSGDSAASGTDYNAVADVTLTIPSGSKSGTATVQITPVNDTTQENDETITISGSAGDYGLSSAIADTSVKIFDNDVLLALSPASVGEEGGAQSVTVTARAKTARAASRALTVSVGKLGDQAVSGTDYGAVTDFSLTIAANQASGTATFTFTPRDDKIIESSETLTVHATGTSLDVNSATLTMTETDTTTIRYTVTPDRVPESDGSWRTMTLNASMKDGYTVAKPVDCIIGNGGGTATYSTDYLMRIVDRVLRPGGSEFTFEIPAGQQSASATLRMRPTIDSLAEGDETVEIVGREANSVIKACHAMDGNLVDIDTLNTDPYPATITITDDETLISLSASPSSVAEDAGDTSVTVTASMKNNAPADMPVTVTVGKTPDAATSGTDYEAVDPFLITIPQGSKSATQTITFTPIDDTLPEDDEDLTLFGTTSKTSVSSSRLTITDDDTSDITLTAKPASVSEGDGSTTVTVTAATNGTTFPAPRNVSVDVGHINDSATEGTDYDAVSIFEVTIPYGKSSGSGTFTLTPVDDTKLESDESISIGGHTPNSDTVNGTSVTIKDNDAQITLSASPSSVAEGAGDTTVTVTATNAGGTVSADTAVTVSVGEKGDEATSVTDYAAVAHFTVTIKSGKSSGTATFTLTPVDDSLYEGSEKLSISGSATGHRVGKTAVTITDNDEDSKATVDLSLKPTRVKECSADTTMTVTAELPDDIYTLPEDRKITLSVGKSGDGATSGTDYTAVDDFTLTIPAGQHTGLATFTLTPTDDTEKEGDETFTVHGKAKRLAVGNDAVATIEDDDQPIIILTMDPKKIPEQEQGKTTTVTVTASLWTGTDSCASDGGGPPDTSAAASAAGASAEEVAKAALGPGARPASSSTDQTVTVTIGDTGDTAVSGTDYTAVTGFNITIKAGDTKGTATFSTRGILDSLLEPPETLTVKGAATGTTVTPTKGSVDDKDQAKPSLTLSPSSVSEGAAATSVTVTLDTGGVSASKSMDVTFKVSSGTAASGTDFAAVADFESVLKAGETSVSGTFTLTPTDDTVIEGDETIKVSVPGANPAVEATLTLSDDDSTDITLAASLSSVAEADSAKTVTVTASTDGDTFVADRTVTVSVGASGDGATSGTDYAAVTDFDITISAGLTSGTGTFTLTPTQDTIIEGDETITVGGTSTGLTVNSDTVTLTDDDSSDITLRVSPSSVAESGGATTVTVTAATDGDTFPGDRTVKVSVGDGGDSATSGTDYAAVTDFDVKISAGDTSGSADFTLTPTQDTIVEGDEAISVDGTSTGLTVNGASVTLGDDDSTEITLSTNPASVSEGASGTSVTVTATTDGDTFKTDRTLSVTVGNGSLDSAAPGTDYAAVTGFDVTIAAGDTSGSADFTLTPTEDTIVGGDETITIEGSSTGLTVNEATLTLADNDDGSITLSANPDSVSEGASGTSVTVTAAISGVTFATDRTVTVTVGDSSDSADSGTDYAAVTDFDIAISAGQTSGTGTFTLTPTQDRIIEGDESITVGGTSTGVTVNSDTITMTDDDSTDTTLKVTVPNQTGAVKVPEGAEATTATVTVSTDGDSFKTDRIVTVSVGASGDGATSGIDYAAVADLDITITAGDTSGSGTFVITPKQDTLVEGDEGISVSGTSTGLAVNGDSVTIVDDDTAPAINLSTNPSSVSEGAAATSVTVTATFSSSSTYPAAKTVSVTVGDSADSATSGTDYAAVTGFDITISAGQGSGSATFTLTPKDDTLVEGGETISVDGSSTGLTVNGGSVTLSDDDDAPAINLSANPSSVSESAAASSVTVTAEFSNTNIYAADKTVTVTVGDSGDSATSGTDYSTVADFNIVIEAGDTSATGTFTLTPTDDTLVEDNESLSVGGASTGMNVNSGSVTLTDDDGAPAINLSVNPSSVSEGAAATSVAVTATFSSSSTYGAAKTVSVTVGDSADGATSGTDYAAVSDFDVTIAAGDSSGSATFTLTPTDDSLVEGNETLSLSGTSDLTVNGASVTLTDDDGAPAINLSTSPTSVSEGAGDTTVTVTATFSNSSTYGAAKTVSVTVGDSADSAVSGTDYAAVTPFDLTIAAGQSSGTATFTLTPTDDTSIEGNETLSLSGASDLTVNGASMTLTDDDSTEITLSVDPSSVKEDDTATKMIVTAETDGDTFTADRTVRVKVGSASDSATSGTDYAAVTAFDITIAAGDTSGTGNFTLTLTDDNIIEGEEAISVSGTSTGLTVNAASVTIKDNDEPKIILDIKPFLESDPDKLPESAGATRVTVTAGTTGGVFDLDRQIHVTVGKKGDTAVFGPDYDTPSVAFHVLIKANATEGEKTFTLTPTDDILVEGDESLTLQGSAAGLEVTEATITIKDNDNADMTLAASPARVSEGAGATTVTVTVSTGGVAFTADRAVTVTVGDTGDSAVSGTDYAPVSAFDIPISAGQTSATGTFTLTPTDDSLIEGSESITLSGAATGLTVADTGLTIADNDRDGAIDLSVEPSSVSEGDGATTVTVTAAFSNTSTYAADQRVSVSVGGTGTADSGIDYASVADFDLTITRGTTRGTGTFILTPIQDTLIEGSETIGIAGSAAGLTVQGANLSLIDDDEPSAALTLSGARAEEGEGMTFTATLDKTVPGGFTATPAYTDGSAAAGSDYAPNTAALSFAGAAGERHSFTVATMEDTEVEPDETFSVALSIAAGDSGDATGAKRAEAEGAQSGVATASAAGTIVNDDAYKIVVRAKIKLSADPDRLGEDADPVAVELTATADTAIARARTVRVSVGGAGDDAVEGTDYAQVGDFDLTIAANAAEGVAEFELAPQDDNLVEGDETISVSGVGADMDVEGTAITLVDDEVAPTVTLSLDPSTVGEGEGATAVTVTATFSNGVYSQDKTVTVSVGGSGTATPGTDYGAVADFDITIAANASSGAGAFELAPQDDELVEGEETIGVSGAAAGLTVHGAELALADDDRATLTIDDASAAEGGAMTFTVTLDKAVPGGLTATPVYTDGTAAEGADYAANTAALSFAGEAGETETFAVSTADDAAHEGDETFTVGLSVSGTSLGVSAEDTGTGTIVDDDAEASERLLKLHEPILADLSLAMTESVVDAVSGRIERAGRGGPSRRFDYAGGGGHSAAHGGQYGDGYSAPGVAGIAPAGPGMASAGGLGGSPHDAPGMTATPHGASALQGSGPGGMVPMGGSAMAPMGGARTALTGAYGGRGDPHRQSMRQKLGGLSFEYSLGDPEDSEDAGGGAAIWGQGDLRSLNGSHDYQAAGESVAWNGDVLGLVIGMDRRLRPGLLAGVAMSRFDSEMDYRARDAEGQFEGVYRTSMTSVHPYANWAATPRLDLWAAGGYGEGEIRFDEIGLGEQKADSDWLSGAAGGKLLLAELEGLLPGGATTLNMKADAFATRLDVRDNGELVRSLSVRAHRLRLAMVGEHKRTLASGATFAPALEVGARRDGGAGETGTGLEVGGRLRYASAGGRLEVELRAHTLAAFGGGKEEWGVGGSVQFLPGPLGRGFSFALRPSYGAAGAGAEGMWGRRPEQGFAAPLAAQLDSEFGYGLRVRGGLLTLLSGFAWQEEGSMRQTAGALLERNGLGLRLDLERLLTREGPQYGVMLRLEKALGAGPATADARE